VDLPSQGERIADKIREVIEETIGLKMAREPKVSLRTVSQAGEAPVKSGGVKKPSSAESEESQPTLPDVTSYSIGSSDKDSLT
jgi:hypothetical protein